MPYKCNVCGRDFELLKSLHYISRDEGVVLSGFSALAGSKENEPNIYDSFDCPYCGSQNIIQKRKRIFFGEMSNIQEMIDSSIAKQVEQAIDENTPADSGKEWPVVGSEFCCGCHEFDGFGCDRSPMEYCLKCTRCANFYHDTGTCEIFPQCKFEDALNLKEDVLEEDEDGNK